ncbi:hypothetical protein KKC32_03815 [Patescibacteria group bacterium]|nr:hypothetical protein [Patescibacteria group bacterium]
MRQELCENVQKQICQGQFSQVDVMVQPVGHGLQVHIPSQRVFGKDIPLSAVRHKNPTVLVRKAREVLAEVMNQ